MINKNSLSTNGYALDCPLAEDLDSSLKSSMGISGGISEVNDEIYYNSINRGDSFYGSDGEVDPELIKAGLQTATAVVSGVSQGRAAQGACKRPLIRETFLNRAKWAEYRDCLAREERQKQRELEIAQAQAQANANRGGGNTPFTEDDKILGMPKGLAIGIGVVLGISIVGIIVYKVVQSKQVNKA